jgi:hypothetical protein
MSIILRSLVLAAATLTVAAGGAQAWERAPAPVEFANRAERSAPARVQLASGAPVRRAAAPSLEAPEMLYGYGRAVRNDAQPPLDLRGTLRAGASSDLLGADAFDDVPAAMPQYDAAEPAALAAPPFVADVPAVIAAAAEAPALRSGAYFVQVGAFADPSNAERVRTALLDVGVVSVDVREGPSVTLHRVRLGQWASRGEAELARDMIAERGFAGAVVASAR